MTNPFDPQTVFFAKHAQHVVLIHFPIGLFIAGVAFDIAGKWTKRQTLVTVADYDLIAAAAMTLPVIATGLLAWHFALEGQRLKGTLLLHLIFGLASSVILWLVAGLRIWPRQTGFFSAVRLPLEIIGVALIGLTGHLGGFLSGVNVP
jgi:uncharacterized membrane protein